MKKMLKTPISYEDIKDLRIGDVIYLTGYMATGRDDVHKRVVQEGMEIPFDLHDRAIMHAGPIVREGDKYEMVAIGPTSSIRMEAEESEFIRKTGVRVIVGKGSMGALTAAGCKAYGAIHTVFPGGCAVLAATHVEEIEDVYWRELGMPEAVWVMKVEKFGPLIVTIDTEGNNLFEENKKKYAEARREVEPELLEMVKHYMDVEE